jgi:catechol 2,3-dioxygenase-like lactoylglutathione lyase family enzyme
VTRRIDHLIYAVADLDVAAARFVEQFGLEEVRRGSHGDVGTANILLSLGSNYLELITTVDATSQHPLAQRVLAASAEKDQLIGFAIEVDDIEAEADRLGTDAVPMDRSGGLPGRWMLTGVAEAMTDVRPFFIQWESGRPASTATERLERVTVSGDVTDLAAWVGGEIDQLDIVEGPPGVRAVLDHGVEL